LVGSIPLSWLFNQGKISEVSIFTQQNNHEPKIFLVLYVTGSSFFVSAFACSVRDSEGNLSEKEIEKSHAQ
jgi:hypothetical protein